MVEANRESTIAHASGHKVVMQSEGTNMGQLRRVVGRNRMIMLNIFKYVAYRRQALTIIGQLCRKYAAFAKSDMSLFEMFEKERKQNYVCSE